MKRAIFVGRWSPFHNGHLELMREKIENKTPLLILIRDSEDEFTPEQRKKMIDKTMKDLNIDAKTLIIDDIESINWGRGVGYQVNEIKLEKEIESISATEVRKRIKNKDDSWKLLVPSGTIEVLSE